MSLIADLLVLNSEGLTSWPFYRYDGFVGSALRKHGYAVDLDTHVDCARFNSLTIP